MVIVGVEFLAEMKLVCGRCRLKWVLDLADITFVSLSLSLSLSHTHTHTPTPTPTHTQAQTYLPTSILIFPLTLSPWCNLSFCVPSYFWLKQVFDCGGMYYITFITVLPHLMFLCHVTIHFKSVDGVVGTWTARGRLVGTDQSPEPW